MPAPAAGGEEPEEGAADGELANTLRWTTASEQDNFGFDIYRGDSAEGPFERISQRPVPARGSADTPTEYRYVDRDIEAERAYYYYVESISIHGRRERFTPVMRAPPKPSRDERRDGEAADEESPQSAAAGLPRSRPAASARPSGHGAGYLRSGA